MTKQMRVAMAAVVTLAATLAVAAAWRSRQEAARRLIAVTAQSTRCHEVAGVVERLRDYPAILGGGTAISESSMYQHIEESVRAIGLQSDKVIRSIRPQAAQSTRPGETPMQALELSLQGITLPQLVQLLQKLCEAHPEVQVTGMRLGVPEGVASSTRWTVEPLELSFPAGGSGSADRQERPSLEQ